jgi:hypothetical protein
VGERRRFEQRMSPPVEEHCVASAGEARSAAGGL